MIPAFGGDSGTGGTLGLVPAPPAGSGGSGFVLSATGLWVAGGGGGGFNPALNYAPTGTWNFSNASFSLSGLATATTANILYVGVGGIITQGAAPTIANAFLITGNNNLTGSSYLGSSNAQDLFFKTNDIVVCQITSGQDVIWANTVDYQINSSATFLVASAAVSIASTSLSLQSSGAVTLATSGSSSLQIGFTGLPVTLLADTLGISTNGDITLNCATSFTATGDSFFITGTTGIALNATSLSVGNSATSFMTIGNALCNTTIDATLLKLPNMPAAVGGEKIVMIDTVTGQLRISP